MDEDGAGTGDQIRVLVVDDQELMRSALRMMVQSQPDLTLVGEGADGHDALALVRRHRVDVVLMDIRMPRLDGIEATKIIAEEQPRTRVLALTTFDLDEYAFPALRAGASGFLLKDARAEDVVAAIRTVHAGHGVVAPSTTRRLIEHVATSVPEGAGRAAAIRECLTPRELEMLLELATGDSNAEIARRIHLSEATVKTHVGHVLSKLRLRDRVQAVVLAYETGLVRPR
ncbi:response regulator transcription factor [Ruania alba]|uniref:DNA-binding response regulator, NarL/FixJ family, contains REC and HTH domains n=1 Tax=Ruania alba TaxID=648782 RepID=A0A1H5KRI9_9MICO|nr:response regulator transcription factor [Ruania alba]SEE66598.1 DNA-binding response regulator, NarL/FixJ family, contains REC and HTH domains [Ruania alba]